MKKVAIALVVVAMLAGCATAMKITAAALSFIQTVDEKKAEYCDAGYLPPYACEKYEELKAEAKAKWDEYKDRFIDWIVEYIVNNADAEGGADITTAERMNDILISAEMNLPLPDYNKLKAAVDNR